eukprot:maker-scaffold1087_size63509-snap-gene-0.14 protein:Tk11017 transcript:maker-scaffold1087_size63509-snap-gene-0.14-mRNA-1 annotation:"hypothetical protein DAPPUDRAFT_305061"
MASTWVLVWIPVRDEETKLRSELSLVPLHGKNKSKKLQDDKKKNSRNEFFPKGGKFAFDNPAIEEEDSNRKQEAPVVEETRPASLEDTLQEVLQMLKITCFTNQKSDNGKYVLSTFCVPSSKTEIVLICLQQHGIGNNDYTSVSVVPSSIQLRGDHVLQEPAPKPTSKEVPSPFNRQLTDKAIDLSKLENRISNFYNSIKSRLLVAEVVSRIKAGGDFNFDFLMLLFLAGCIAFMGLIENSTVTLVASMLVSPLMGPILSGIFGSVIRDSSLRNQGIKNELISLCLCLTMGFTFGIIFAPWIDTYGVPQWPTPEMQARGQLRSLIGGVLIATPSGAGVAMSVLGGNSGSLVGVAISASLLPPAVNCGLLWAVSFISAISGKDYLVGYRLASDLNSTLPIYTPAYSDNLVKEAALLGIVSFTLTLVNIICIIVTGIGILKLKEVTPDKIPQSFSTFWKEDVKVHREYNQAGHKEDPNLLQEARDVLGIGKDDAKIAKDAMASLRIPNFTTQRSSNGKYVLYTFVVAGSKTEIALICLQQHGIGNNDYTSVSVIPSSIQLRGDHVLEEPSKDLSTDSARYERPVDLSKLENRISNFYKSVKSRLLVAQVVDQIKSGGEFNFDFVMMLFLAGCIAFMGLLENSTVTLVASMLVSPLMGPILSGIFGSAISNKALKKQGIRNEIIALTICVVLGFSFGIIFTCWVQYGNYGIPLWPTPEMQARGQLRTLIGGALIATPSGAGVAMSILGGNSGSLVGVAISASLLPPAVNCGFLWSVSFISAVSGNQNFLIGYRLLSDKTMANSSLPIFYPAYSDNMMVETAILGIVSFTLTVVNIVCIIFTGIGILKLKEVTPDKIPQSFATFWKEDIKAHRDYNAHNVNNEDPNQALLQEARDVLGLKGDDIGSGAMEENFLQSGPPWAHLPRLGVCVHPSLVHSALIRLSVRVGLLGHSGVGHPRSGRTPTAGCLSGLG